MYVDGLGRNRLQRSLISRFTHVILDVYSPDEIRDIALKNGEAAVKYVE